MRGKNASSAVLRLVPWRPDAGEMRTMSSLTLIVLVFTACLYQATTKPVRRTLNFNMFVLKPQEETSERTILTTDGINRFGPILEYVVQRLQGAMSVRLPPEAPNKEVENKVPIADVAENEVDGIQEAKMPGVVVRPSHTKPGTYEVEIDVVVDDGQPNKL
ncbi:unnamed protein product [Euphydryas editha]|uniref:Uncharacterized protein n=1 Tax=Euphydryas editha TaxID=104508 RepID=A0AAU9V8Y5_EUPED|nr:unnamed protein product [Euphydryas editha]